MKSLFIACLSLLLFCSTSFSQEKIDSTLKPEETTFYDAPVNSPITQGLVIKTRSGHYYEITGKVKEHNTISNPSVSVYKVGRKYSLMIQGIEKPMQIFKIKEVYESYIDGDFKGWSDSTTFTLQNNQIWQKIDNKNLFANKFRPAVVVYRINDGSYAMKVEGIEDNIVVVRKK